MDQVSGPKKDPLGVILGVKGQYGQNSKIVVKYLVGKLITQEIHLHQYK